MGEIDRWPFEVCDTTRFAERILRNSHPTVRVRRNRLNGRLIVFAFDDQNEAHELQDFERSTSVDDIKLYLDKGRRLALQRESERIARACAAHQKQERENRTLPESKDLMDNLEWQAKGLKAWHDDHNWSTVPWRGTSLHKKPEGTPDVFIKKHDELGRRDDGYVTNEVFAERR